MIPTAQSRLGRIVRLPLRLIPADAVVPVLSGLNRGLRWQVGSSVHGCWIGSYEREKQNVLAELLRPDMCALDIGAQAGFYTLALARRVSSVWAFEPSPLNAESLLFHMSVNGLRNVRVEQVAIADFVGTATFDAGPSRLMGRLANSGRIVVSTTTIDTLLGSGMPAPDLVKIDVEGGELSVLRGARGLIARRRTIWLVALDDPSNRASCLAELSGYHIDEFWPGEILARPA